MSKIQIMIVLISIIIILLMGLFPPLIGHFSVSIAQQYCLPGGYGYWLTATSLKAPEKLLIGNHKFYIDREFYIDNKDLYWIAVIDYKKLIAQWIITAAITAGALCTIGSKKQTP